MEAAPSLGDGIWFTVGRLSGCHRAVTRLTVCLRRDRHKKDFLPPLRVWSQLVDAVGDGGIGVCGYAVRGLRF